jgi:hypothetical protein
MKALIDTPQMQRLRDIKQLGTAGMELRDARQNITPHYLSLGTLLFLHFTFCHNSVYLYQRQSHSL